jgi:hypothetical protein
MAPFHHHAVQDGGVHADEGIVLDLAGMQQCHVSDRGTKTTRGDMEFSPTLILGPSPRSTVLNQMLLSPQTKGALAPDSFLPTKWRGGRRPAGS